MDPSLAVGTLERRIKGSLQYAAELHVVWDSAGTAAGSQTSPVADSRSAAQVTTRVADPGGVRGSATCTATQTPNWKSPEPWSERLFSG
ncbi:hypothetical protein GCM10009854_17240 [Saccharopolyspora halophila]|uniref:Uncharacterized protein n=1 Tax=Saccharopolyspora halophila TaxID=405551 RepID=A0ABN3FZY2_9PSEU